MLIFTFGLFVEISSLIILVLKKLVKSLMNLGQEKKKEKEAIVERKSGRKEEKR